MIQLNLLPDVKLEYIKAQRLKRLVTTISLAVSAVSVVVLVLFIVSVDIVQKQSLRDLDTDTTKYSKQLEGVKDLDKILTVQNQLTTLSGLHDQKVVSSLVSKYLAQITPTTVTLSSFKIDFVANTITMDGQAPGLDTINQFVDTIKTATYTSDAVTTDTPAFSSVVLSSFGIASATPTSPGGATFAVATNFDPVIFSNQHAVTIKVPTSTTSNIDTLFRKQAGS